MNPRPRFSPTVDVVSVSSGRKGPSTRRKGFLVIAVTLVALVIAAAGLWGSTTDTPSPQPSQITTRQALVDALDGPGGRDRVQIDVTLYAPAQTPAPAILLAHGFGEDKNSVSGEANELAARGFTVLAYSARGFGRSTGQIALNSPDYEVADAHQLIDWLSRQPEVARDGENDPKIGVTGSSYGGALSLLLAGTDPRVKAVAPVMTYNDLEQALLPNSSSGQPIPARTPAQGTSTPDGVFKQGWAGLLFASGAGGGAPHREMPEPDHDAGDAAQPTLPGGAGPPEPATCGNFRAEVCAAYTEVAQTGKPSPATLNLLAAASPKSVTHNIKAPTLLVQGERDSLFGLDQADANARQIAAAGAKVKTIWYPGGHDGSGPGPAIRSQIADWFAYHLAPPGHAPVPDPGTGFEYVIAGQPQRDGKIPEHTVAAAGYPGLGSGTAERSSLPLHGPAARVINPPGGVPAATSAIPGAGSISNSRFGAGIAHDFPGQTAVFRTDPLGKQMLISGVSQARISVAAVPGQPNPGDAVLFAKLYDVGADGERTLTGNAVSPLRVTDLPPDGSPVETNVALPGVVQPVEAGHHLELAVTTTDQAYRTPTTPAVYRVGLAGDNALSVPTVAGTSINSSAVPVPALTGIGLILAGALLVWLIAAIRRGHADDADPDLADTPLVFSQVAKSYPGRLTAVRDLSMRVERGQVVGLLGPNGAGKTTTLRMLLGLVRPSRGEIRVFGHRVFSGAPALSRIGAFVEGPGFLPHLSGVSNLRSYWAATGRPWSEAKLDEVLRIAGLGKAARRRVRTYSRGMKQRLSIAQAMLGMPDLLVLDEPTDALDPPQIRQLRDVLRRYAETGRSVLLSSHLLSEVEQICTHVVVMHLGEVVAEGSVTDLAAVDGQFTFRVDQPGLAAESLRSLEGIGDVRADGDRVHADLAGHAPAVAVNVLVASGVAISQISPRRRLEDAFLQLVGQDDDAAPKAEHGEDADGHTGTAEPEGDLGANDLDEGDLGESDLEVAYGDAPALDSDDLDTADGLDDLDDLGLDHSGLDDGGLDHNGLGASDIDSASLNTTNGTRALGRNGEQHRH